VRRITNPSTPSTHFFISASGRLRPIRLLASPDLAPHAGLRQAPPDDRVWG
jgi:hypothetical protein